MSLALTAADLELLSEVFALLAERQDEHGLRVALGEQLSRLLGADFYASYLWSEVTIDQRELAILRLVAPAFRNALRRSAQLGEAACPREELALTEREAQIARLVAHGLSDKEIAQSLGISFTTVRTHIKRAFGKLGVDNRVKLAAHFRAQPAGHWIDPVRK